MNKIYWSNPIKEDWQIADRCWLFAIPSRWWSIKHWILVNQFCRHIEGFVTHLTKNEKE